MLKAKYFALLFCLAFCFGCPFISQQQSNLPNEIVSAKELAETELGIDLLIGRAVFDKNDFQTNVFSIPGGTSDGCAMLILELSDVEVRELEAIVIGLDWRQLPLSSGETELLKRTSCRWPSKLSPEFATEGRWLLRDHQSRKDTKIVSRASFNFTFALLDTKRRIFFFQKLDS